MSAIETVRLAMFITIIVAPLVMALVVMASADLSRLRRRRRHIATASMMRADRIARHNRRRGY